MIRNSRMWLMVGCLALGTAFGYFLNREVSLQAQPAQRPIPAIPRELTSYRDIVKDVVPAVVSIESKKARRPKGNVDGGAVVAPGQGVPLGFGSGVIVDPKGVILTCYHVIEEAETVEVTLHDGRKLTAKQVLADRKSDLAVVKVEADKALPFLEFGDSDAMEVGDRVLAIGAPFGLMGSVTHGIISAKSRNVRINQYEDFLQTDAAINPGNSGGPLVSLEGKVIAINSAIKSRNGGFQGVGLAISSKLSKTILTQLLKDGTVRRAYLGVSVRDLEPVLGNRVGLKDGGVVVTRIFPESPAARGGVKVGDIIITLGGKTVRDGAELQKVIAALPPNQATQIDVFREGKSTILRVVVAEQPDDFGVMEP